MTSFRTVYADFKNNKTPKQADKVKIEEGPEAMEVEVVAVQPQHTPEPPRPEPQAPVPRPDIGLSEDQWRLAAEAFASIESNKKKRQREEDADRTPADDLDTFTKNKPLVVHTRSVENTGPINLNSFF